MGETNCPSCGLELADGETVAGKKQLSGLDVGICRGCGEIVVVYRRDMQVALRSATAGDYLSLPEDDQMVLRAAFEIVRERCRMRNETPLH
ncbi:MAG TPA: hypothetical protein VFB15_08700 [Candidatus Binataceae bacterium]|nr:hypothetical protein [Candidatus Binataceae bacterium]